ncbi:MAG: gpW family head-tail joining protein [Syntrophobacteraceae bacterium]
MAYTQSDLDSVKAAIIALATGQRIVTVTIDGMTVQKALADLNDLRALRVEMERSLRASAGRPSFYLTWTSKGL